MASTGPQTSSHDYNPVTLPQTPTRQNTGNMKNKSVTVGTSSVDPSLAEVSQDSSTQQPGWTSSYLKKASLLGFAASFLALLLAVIVLAVVDAKQDGIANARSNEHYLWTYGPTAVLVIVAALWNQVEYRTKHAMPFAVLQSGSTLASETLLLDYVTPSKPEALLKAFRKSHWPVVIAILNSLLIILLTVASTGLLVLQETAFTQRDCRLDVTDRFVTDFETSKVGSAPVLATIAISNGTIDFPRGTSRDAAFRSLKAPSTLSGSDNIQVEGSTGSFRAGLKCEAASITSGHSGCADRQCHSLNVSLAITSQTCQIESYNLTTACGMGIDAISCGIENIWGAACDTYADGRSKNRLVFLNAQMNQDLGSATENGTEPLKILSNDTAIIVCEPSYEMVETSVLMDQHGKVEPVPNYTDTSLPQLFPAWDLVDGLLTATSAAGTILNDTYDYNSYDYFPWRTLDTFFSKWVDAAHPVSDLRDPNVLQSRAEELFSMVTAQMAKQSLTQPSTDFVLGTCHGVRDRLRVRGLSLYLMGAILITLIVSTTFLLYVAPRSYSSRDPTSIGGLALVVSQSPALCTQLSSLGSADLKTIRERLAHTKCQGLLSQHHGTWRSSIDLTSVRAAEDQDAAPAQQQDQTFTYWRPLSLRPTFKGLVIVCLLATVVILEVLFSISQKRNGLAEVDPKTDQRFAWAYVPATAMVMIQTLVGMVAFSTLVMFPYFQLRGQDTSTRQDVLRHYVSETAVKCLWQAVVAKHIVVCCMALAMLLAPVLTIAVSGLYTAFPTSANLPVTISIHEQFNSSFKPRDLGFEVGGEIAKAASNDVGMLLTQNFTFPAWTYDELAFPKISMSLSDTTANTPESLMGRNVTVTLPAIRSSLNCTVASSVPTNFTDILDIFPTPVANVTAFEALGVNNWHGTVPGSFLLWPGPGSESFGYFTACGDPYSRDMFNTFCGAFGTSEVNWNAFTCLSHIDELDVEVDLNAASLSVLAARPKENTRRFFSNETLCSGLRDAFPSDMVPSLFGGANFGSQKASAGFFDPAFQAVVYGLGTHAHLEDFPMAAYMNNEGVSKIFDQLEHVHRTVVAQSANLIRMTFNATLPRDSSATVNATLINPHVYRLKQSALSTRVLDGLLLTIAICIAVTFLMDTRRVLPKNPASIAAATSLIAGESQMLSKESLPEGAQWYSDAELEAKRVWDGVFFRLGWWDSDGPSEHDGNLFKLDNL